MRQYRNKKTKAGSNYWSIEQDNAVKAYQVEVDPDKRNDIYNTYLHQPLSKIVEVYTNKNISHMTYEDLHQHIISYLVTKVIPLIDYSKHESAFPLLCLAAKQQAWIMVNKAYNRKITHLPLECKSHNTGEEIDHGDNMVFDMFEHPEVFAPDFDFKRFAELIAEQLDEAKVFHIIHNSMAKRYGSRLAVFHTLLKLFHFAGVDVSLGVTYDRMKNGAITNRLNRCNRRIMSLLKPYAVKALEIMDLEKENR